MEPDPADAPPIPQQAADRCQRLLDRLRQDRTEFDAPCPSGPGALSTTELAEGRAALDRAIAAAARLGDILKT